MRRLQQELEARGYQVVYANAADYLNLGEPVEIEELLVVIAGAFSDRLYPKFLKESYWARFLNYLRSTDVNFSEANFKMDWVSLKAEIRSSPTFKQRVRDLVQSRLPEVRRQVQAFVSEAVEEKEPGTRVVFLFDSFEKLRGTPSNEQEVMSSLERLLGSYLDMLQLPYVHCVYSVNRMRRADTRLLNC